VQRQNSVLKRSSFGLRGGSQEFERDELLWRVFDAELGFWPAADKPGAGAKSLTFWAILQPHAHMPELPYGAAIGDFLLHPRRISTVDRSKWQPRQ